MKNKKLLSVLLVAVLLVSCIVGILVLGAGAAEEAPTVIYTVGEVELEGSVHFETMAEAFGAAQENNKKWAANDVLEIRFKGSITGGAQDGLLFGQTTIWREDGTKLPIIIRGVDSETPRDAYIYLDSAGGWYACANDYTFINLTLPVGDQDTSFYAGSGNVTFENVYFKQQKITIKSTEDQKIQHQLMSSVSQAVAERNGVDLIPAGEAWYDLITNNPDVGTNLWRTIKLDRPEGDYKHDGNIGGGQYLNACIWYEVLTKTSCVGNTWRPDESYCGYTLDEALVPVLQEAAHKAVVAEYGEDYYDSTYSADLNEDGAVNVLIIGSSNGYYFPDELCQMATASGLTIRVCTAYHSGVYISTQWSWASGAAAGDYQFRIYEADSVTNDIGVPAAEVSGVGFEHFQTKYVWDSITFYQTAGAFDDYGVSLDKYSKVLATCEKADNLYAYMKETNPNARYSWYQVACNPVGYPGVSTSLTASSGRFFADNCTQAVYAGWPELAEGEKVKTSLTFGEGTTYYASNYSTTTANQKYFIAAVGFMEDYEGDPLTKETAAEVTYEVASLGEEVAIADIRPIDVDASIIIDCADFQGHNVTAHLGHAPSAGTVHLKKGTVYTIDGDNRDSTAEDYYYGDMTLKVSGGTVTNCVYATYSSHVVGNIVIDISQENDDYPTTIAKCIRGTFGTGVVAGDITMSVSGGTIGPDSNGYAFYGGGDATGEIVNNVSGGTLTGAYFGIRQGGAGKTVVNNITGGTIDGPFYGGHYSSTALGQIVNNFSGGTITGRTITVGSNSYSDIYAGGFSTSSKTTGLAATVEGEAVTAAIINNISGTTFGTKTTVDGTTTRVGNFYGSHRGGGSATAGDIYNIVAGGTFYYRFYGSTSNQNVGNVTTKISGSPVFDYAFYAMGYDKTVANSEGKTLTVDITGGNFNSTSYYAGQILRNRIANVTVDGVTCVGAVYCSGYNGTAKEVNVTIKGGTFEEYFYGGEYNASTSVNPQQINLTIEGGTFERAFFGGSRGIKTGNVHVIVRNNPQFKGNFAPGGWNKTVTGTTAADTVTGNIKMELYGGTFTNIYSGSSDGTVGNIDNIVDGATLSGEYYGGYGGTMGTISNTIKSGTFGGNVYLGPWGGSSTCENITNNVSGGEFAAIVYFGARRSTATTGDITNTVSGGTFSVEAYLGSADGEVGNITNNISSGTFKQKVYMGSAAGTAKAVSNTITGGNFSTQYNSSDNTKKYYYFFGAGVGSSTSVENTITGGTFYGNAYLGGAGAVSGDIVNEIGNDEGGPNFATKGISLYCGNYKSESTVGNISNTFHNGSFKSVYCGNSFSDSFTGSITNIFNGGTYTNSITTCGYSTTNGKVLTTINDGTYNEYILGGGRGQIYLPEGSEDYYCLETVINGGTFKGVWNGGEGTSTIREGNIKLTIFDGIFNNYNTSASRQNAVAAGGRGMRHVGNADVFIYGGTFNAEVVAGSYPNSNEEGYAKANTDCIATVTIYGGTFNGPLMANSKWELGNCKQGTVILNPTESDIIINSTMVMRTDTDGAQAYEIVGGDKKIVLGTDAVINATSASGDIKIEQIENWKKQVYVTLPAGNEATVTVTTAEGATGTYSRTLGADLETIEVKGGVAPTAATMILTDRIAVRVLFAKETIDGIEDFTYSFTMSTEEGTVILAEGNELAVWEKDSNYYYVLLQKVGVSDFAKTITLSGSDEVWEATFSIVSLAEVAESAWEKEGTTSVQLAQAIQDLSAVANGGSATHGLSADLTQIGDFEASYSRDTENSKLFNVTGKGLLMSNAVGIRIYGTVENEEDLEGLTVTVNGTPVTELAVITSILNTETGHYDVTVDLYVSAKNMENSLTIVINDKNNVNCLTLTDRVDAIAASYTEEEYRDTYRLAEQLLIYIQKANAYGNESQQG